MLKHEASVLNLDIKMKDGKFHFGLFDKRDSFPVSIVRMSDKSSNVPSSIVYSAIGAESLRIARASNNPESFSTSVKPLIAHMGRQGVSIRKINSFILKFCNKHQVDFNNVCQSKQELLNLASMSFYSFRPTNNIGCYRYADKTVMPVFSKCIKNKIKNKNNK